MTESIFHHKPNKDYAPYIDISRTEFGEYWISIGTASIAISRTTAADLYRALLRDLIRTEKA